jgi:hypothetical protein
MALMVAANGQLPPQETVAVARMIEHRLSWRDLQRLESAPDVVLSAACSSGASLVGGLGERLGLYGALRHAGTRAVVAPAWDCIADDTLLMLDQVYEIVARGVPLGVAVKQVADDASHSFPTWRARVLAIEGDWR